MGVSAVLALCVMPDCGLREFGVEAGVVVTAPAKWAK